MAEPSKSTINRRQVILTPDLEDGGWVVQVPSLPGCISQGDTREEALANIRDAIETWIDGTRSVGMEIPEESFGLELCVV